MNPQDLEALWHEHLAGEFVTKDVEATLSTMTDDASVDHVPVHTGGSGKQALRAFYRDVFIPSWPADLKQTPINRVDRPGSGRRRDQDSSSLTTGRWSGSCPACRRPARESTSMIVAVVQFREGKIACERIYWDQATVLRQVGLLKP